MVNITNLVEIFAKWILALQELWDFFNTTLNDFIVPIAMSFPPVSLVWGFFNLLGLGNLTLLEFILGAGLALYLGYQFIIWVLNLIT